jgi:hypothetical protein
MIVGTDMYTIKTLLDMAAEAEKEYLRLRKKFPPGTYNKDRNDKYAEMQNAITCASWMDRNGIIEAENVGPFNSTLVSMLKKKDRVKIKKGSIVYSTHPNIPREGIVTNKIQTVTIHSIEKGYMYPDVKNGSIHWVGENGYWKWTDINNILGVK